MRICICSSLLSRESLLCRTFEDSEVVGIKSETLHTTLTIFNYYRIGHLTQSVIKYKADGF